MVQAARSGVQNIAEGSQASGTSKKMELKLTNVARASLEELRLDYEDFLRQRGLVQWPREDPRRTELIARRPATADAVAEWAKDMRDGRDGRHGQSGPAARQKSMVSTKSTVSTFPEIAANGRLRSSPTIRRESRAWSGGRHCETRGQKVKSPLARR